MQENLRVMLIKAKVLQMCADIFAVFGIFLFIYIYLSEYQDNATKALRDPTFIFTILIPFMPAALLAYVASRERKKIRAIVEGQSKKSAEETK